MNIIDINGNTIFNSPMSLFEKAKYDFARIKRRKSSELKMIYALFDTIMTINHLFDWVMESENEATKTECIALFNTYTDIREVKNDYKKYYEKNNLPPINNKQFIIRCLSNNIKHYNIRKIDLLEAKTNIAQAGCMYAGSFNAFAGYYELTFQVEDIRDGKTYNLISLLDNILKQWECFLNKSLGAEKQK